MEHRRYMRVPANVDTLIYYHGLPVASGRIRDACRGGIFVDTTFAGIHDLQLLECEFQLAQDRLRLDGHVVRHDPSGMAVWIDEDNAVAGTALRALLSACGGVPSMHLPRAEADRESKLHAFSEV